MISATGLTKSFFGRTVLNDVNIHVDQGRIMGIVGVGGGGKSLLLKLLCGLVQPDTGQVLIDGADLATIDASKMARVRERFGLLFQNNALFDFMTVGDNIAFPLLQQGIPDSPEIREKVASRLRDVELGGAENLYPNQLSGGMKKRVALARATIAGAPLLLYDDPTAGLDPVTSSKIFALIQDLHSADGASVVVGHDIDRMRAICNDWVLIHAGTVRFRGTTADAEASEDPIVQTYFHGGDHHA